MEIDANKHTHTVKQRELSNQKSDAGVRENEREREIHRPASFQHSKKFTTAETAGKHAPNITQSIEYIGVRRKKSQLQQQQQQSHQKQW